MPNVKPEADIIYEHRVSAILQGTSLAREQKTQQLAAEAFYSAISAAQRNERDCGFTPDNAAKASKPAPR